MDVIKLTESQFRDICRWLIILDGRVTVQEEPEAVDAVIIDKSRVAEFQEAGVSVWPGEAAGVCFPVAFVGKE